MPTPPTTLPACPSGLALQQASFRVAAWRNLAALLPFLALFLADAARHGLRAEHMAFLRDRGNWPLLLAGSRQAAPPAPHSGTGSPAGIPTNSCHE